MTGGSTGRRIEKLFPKSLGWQGRKAKERKFAGLRRLFVVEKKKVLRFLAAVSIAISQCLVYCLGACLHA